MRSRRVRRPMSGDSLPDQNPDNGKHGERKEHLQDEAKVRTIRARGLHLGLGCHFSINNRLGPFSCNGSFPHTRNHIVKGRVTLTFGCFFLAARCTFMTGSDRLWNLTVMIPPAATRRDRGGGAVTVYMSILVICALPRVTFFMRSRRAFTLIEIAISVFILLLIVMIAVPSLTGVMADHRLRRSLDDFNNLVRQAQERSVSERRPYLLVWSRNTISLRPMAVKRKKRSPVSRCQCEKETPSCSHCRRR